MLEYIITHMFDEFRLNFPTARVKKGKTHFFQLQKRTKNQFPTCQDFSIDISFIKIRPFLLTPPPPVFYSCGWKILI